MNAWEREWYPTDLHARNLHITKRWCIMTPKILTIDIETSPNLAHVWGLWNQNVSLNQLMESGQVIAFASKWYGKAAVEFRSDFHDGHAEMVDRAHALLDEADIVVHYNGTKFDLPHLRREFLGRRQPAYSPVAEVDLLKVAKTRFRFPSNKLDYVSQFVGLEGKFKHSGHELWVRCMAGDPKAWAEMRRYNKQDVVLTEQLYDILRPYMKTHPHMGLYGPEAAVCGRCGSGDIIRQGFAYTPLGKFQQYQCKGCGSWSRGGKRLDGVDLRPVA